MTMESPGAGRRRLVVVGSAATGKTTLARHLAHTLGLSHVELDALYWDPHWTPAPLELFRERTMAALDRDAWVVDGNYGKVRDIVWSRAETLIWLDYALPVILRRLTRRTFLRLVTRAELWNGNRERFRGQFLSRDSLFLWTLSTYRRRRRDYRALLARPDYSHLAVVHLRSPRSTRRWLEAWASAR